MMELVYSSEEVDVYYDKDLEESNMAFIFKDGSSIVGSEAKGSPRPLAAGKAIIRLNTLYFVLAERLAETKARYRFVDVDTLEETYGDTKLHTLHEIAIKSKDILAKYLSKDCKICIKPGDLLDTYRGYMPSKRTPISKATREEVYKKYSGHCAYCGKPIAMNEMQVDHVTSHYRHNGKDEIGNYLPSCRDCNGLKSDYTLEEFRDTLIPNCARKVTAKGGMVNRARDCRALRIARAYGLDKSPRKKIRFYFEREENKE